MLRALVLALPLRNAYLLYALYRCRQPAATACCRVLRIAALPHKARSITRAVPAPACRHGLYVFFPYLRRGYYCLWFLRFAMVLPAHSMYYRARNFCGARCGYVYHRWRTTPRRIFMPPACHAAYAVHYRWFCAVRLAL